MNPLQYLKRQVENEKANQRRLRIANEIMEKRKDVSQNSGNNHSIGRRPGPKTKKEKAVEERMRDQAAFLLFIAKEKEKEEKEEESAEK